MVARRLWRDIDSCRIGAKQVPFLLSLAHVLRHDRFRTLFLLYQRLQVKSILLELELLHLLLIIANAVATCFVFIFTT